MVFIWILCVFLNVFGAKKNRGPTGPTFTPLLVPFGACQVGKKFLEENAKRAGA